MLLLFCFAPLTAWANAGTGLMWAAMLHMFIGNAVIGVGEGTALAWFFRLNFSRCMIVMVAANYFSAWCGVLFLQKWILPSLSLDLYNGWHWVRLMVGVTFLITLVLEWPFVLFCLRHTPGRLGKSIWGNLAVQSLSYLLLFWWYASTSPTGLYTRMHVVQASELSPHGEGMVFYISATNGNACSLTLDTHEVKEVFPLHSSDRDARLFARPSTADTNHWDVLANSQVLVCSNLMVNAVEFGGDTRGPAGTAVSFGKTPRLGSAAQSDWNFESGFWAASGLRGKNAKTGETLRCSLETPFLQWSVRNATHLPGDRVIFQLGNDQICLLEAAKKKIALIARGRGPVVVIPTETAAQ